MTKTGAFISFEGGDGAGKTTQIKLLANRLRDAGRNVVVTREPGGSVGAEAIRALLVRGDTDRWSPLTEALLMYAARADHLEKTILPALARGAIVITDRFADSTLAYQGIAGEFGEDNVKMLYDLVVGDNGPDLTIILDAPAEEGLRRASPNDGETRFEEKGADFQTSVRTAFLQIARENPDRCIVVNALASIEDVAADIASAVEARLPGILSS
jgi:dTMP kinase